MVLFGTRKTRLKLIAVAPSAENCGIIVRETANMIIQFLRYTHSVSSARRAPLQRPHTHRRNERTKERKTESPHFVGLCVSRI